MDDTRGGPRFAIVFDEVLWQREVERLAANSGARLAAEAARRVLERDGAAPEWLAQCEPGEADGTRLGGCLKLRVPLGRPASEAPYGFVLEPTRNANGRLALRPIAYGERHPDRRATRSVYERGHNRLHGVWPSRP